jgi:hypothetical protein
LPPLLSLSAKMTLSPLGSLHSSLAVIDVVVLLLSPKLTVSSAARSATRPARARTGRSTARASRPPRNSEPRNFCSGHFFLGEGASIDRVGGVKEEISTVGVPSGNYSSGPDGIHFLQGLDRTRRCFGRHGDIEGGCYDVSGQPQQLQHVLGGEAAPAAGGAVM